MEQSGRNHWQPPANAPAPRAANMRRIATVGNPWQPLGNLMLAVARGADLECRWHARRLAPDQMPRRQPRRSARVARAVGNQPMEYERRVRSQPVTKRKNDRRRRDIAGQLSKLALPA
jgi:hypothetical protein